MSFKLDLTTTEMQLILVALADLKDPEITSSPDVIVERLEIAAEQPVWQHPDLLQLRTKISDAIAGHIVDELGGVPSDRMM